MFEPFTLVIPADPRFHPMASDVAGRLAELAGGSAATLSAEMTKALEAVVAGATPADQVRMSFRHAQQRVDVDVSCGSRSKTITCPV
jgi:hypothetical protein